MQTDAHAGEPGDVVAKRWASGLAALSGSLALAVGSLVLVTYARHGGSGQMSFVPYRPAMKPNTALCLISLGAALLVLRRALPPTRRDLRALLLASLPSVLGPLTLLEYVLGRDLGLDRLLLDLPAARMSPITACALSSVSLVIMGSALALRTRWTPGLFQGLLVITGLLSLLPIMGYLYRAPFLYNPGSLTAVAPGTVLGLLSLVVGGFALRCDEGLWPLLMGDTAGSTLARRALPAVMLLPVIFGWLQLEAEHHGNIGLELGVALIAVATVLTFGALAVWSASWLRAQDWARRAAIANLQEARDTLEMRVAERTRELSQTEVELRRAASQLLVAKERAERAMRARADFLARMSHEMRTPLNGVVGMLEIALDSDLTPAQRGYVQSAQSSAHALLGLISDVLDFSKIDAGKLSLEPVPFRLRDCLGLSLRDNAPAAHRKGLELYLDVPSDVPECLVGDAQRLRQVLTNLVSNAVKFTERGEVRLSVRARAPAGGSLGLSFEVSDTGVGIAPDKQREIFEAFTQADGSTTRRFGGTGLGLAISAQLIQLMGGEIKVESELGRGARFFFELELAWDEAAEQALALSRATLQDKRVLVVAPNAAQRASLRSLLSHWGVEATERAPAELAHALQRAGQDEGAAFVLIDEGALGPEDQLLAALRARLGSNCPIVLLTSATTADDARELQLRHCSAQLTKPVVASELFDTLASSRQLRAATSGTPKPVAESVLEVLVVEDNEVNRRVATFVLEAAGYRVTAVEDGHKALVALEERSFDLVLMDGHMPELDGLEATRRIRARERGTGRRTPIIALTAQAMKGDRERYLAAGMDGYLSKPFQSAQLLATIRSVLGRAPAPPARQELAPKPVEAPACASDLPKQTQERARRSSDAPIYDRNQLLSRLRGSERVLRSMTQIYEEEAPRLLSALSAAVQAEEPARVQQSAHKFCGALLTVGGTRAAHVARALENGAREGSLSSAASLMNQLRSELAALRVAMLQHEDVARDPASGPGAA